MSSWLKAKNLPVEFVSPALDSEVYTRQLWIFEGITSYYDDLGLLPGKAVNFESMIPLE